MKLSFVSLLASTWLTLDCLQDIIEWAIILITVRLYIEEIFKTFEEMVEKHLKKTLKCDSQDDNNNNIVSKGNFGNQFEKD